MTARTLDLREACLQAPTAYDVAIVGSMMLFPADEELRRRTLGAVDIDLRLQSTNLQLTPAEMRQFIELIRIMPRPADYEEQIKDAYASGIIVGRMLLQVLAGSTLTAIKKDIASGYRTSVSTINSRWHDYQCVAAY